MNIKRMFRNILAVRRRFRLPDVAQNSARSSTSIVLALRKYLIYTSIERSIEIIRRNFVAFATLVLLFQTPIFLYEFYRFQFGGAAEEANVLVSLISISIGVLLYFINISALVYGTIQDLNDRPAGFRNCIKHGLIQTFSITGTILVLTGAWLVGFAIFVFPAFIITTILWLTIPSAMVEKISIIESLKRSIYLTRTYRWQIFSAIMTFSILHLQLQIISDFQIGHSIIISILGFLAGCFVIMVQGVACSVFYHNVRNIKEGPAREQARSRRARRLQVGAAYTPTE